MAKSYLQNVLDSIPKFTVTYLNPGCTCGCGKPAYKVGHSKTCPAWMFYSIENPPKPIGPDDFQIRFWTEVAKFYQPSKNVIIDNLTGI